MSMTKPIYTPFGIWIKTTLMKKGMKQKELAQALGVKDEFLSDILTGKKQGYDYTGKIIEILTEEKHQSSVG